jgi:2-dehydropantoate 2-reductase
MTEYLRRVAPRHRPTVAVVGVGAIGTVVADALSARAEVTLCRRGQTAPMAIDVDGDLRRVDAAVAATPDGLGPVDWVVVTVKAQDTRDIGPWLDALVGPATTVVMLQNGIGHAERVSEWVPAERVLPGIVYIAAEKIERDLVVCRDLGALAVATGSAASSFAALVDPRLSVRLVDDFVTESWTKLVMNSSLNTLTALTDRTMEVTADPAVRPLFRALLAEGVAVATAEGARLPEGAAELFLARMDGLPRNSATSMLLDRRSGRPLEHDYLTGAVLAAAERSGVAAPTVALVHGLIDALDNRELRLAVARELELVAA